MPKTKTRKRTYPTIAKQNQLQMAVDGLTSMVADQRGLLGDIERAAATETQESVAQAEDRQILRGLLFETLAEIPRHSVLTNRIRRFLSLPGESPLQSAVQSVFAGRRRRDTQGEPAEGR